MSDIQQVEQSEQVGEQQVSEQKINENLQIAVRLTEFVLQEYIAYLDGSKVEDIFDKVASENTFLEFKKNDINYKLKLAIVHKDYMFPLDKCHSDEVVEYMTNMIQSCVIVYALLVKNLNNTKSDIFDQATILSVDPSNTTIVANSQKYGEKIFKKDKRIGFIWA